MLGRLDDVVIVAVDVDVRLLWVAGEADKNLRFEVRGWRKAQAANDSSSSCSPFRRVERRIRKGDVGDVMR